MCFRSLSNQREITPSEDSALLGTVFVKPKPSSGPGTDRSSNHSPLLAFDHAAGYRPGSRADSDYSCGAARPGHPAVLVLIVYNPRSIEERDPPLTDPN